MTHLAVASALLFAILVLDAQRRGDRGAEPTAVTWADSSGGFEIVFPAEWESTEGARDESRHPIAGSTHRRPAGGTLLRRHLSARAYDLGVIPPGITTKNLVALASGIRAPGETIVHPALAGQGVYVSAYRAAGTSDGESNAAVFFRGRDGHGFMLEITGHRDDELLLVDEAFAIANSLRHEQWVLNDLAILLAQAFAVPPDALEGARSMEMDIERAREMDARRRPPGVPRPIVVNANLLLDTGTATASADECRARAVLLFSQGLPPVPGSLSRPVEFRMTCQTSTVAVGFDFRAADLVLRQFDLTGELIYEESVRPDFFLFVGSPIGR